MGFGFFPASMLDPANLATGAGPTGTPGARTRSQALPPRTAAERALTGLGAGNPATDRLDLIEHARALVGLASAAERVLAVTRAGSPVGGACDRVAELAAQAAPHVVAIGEGLDATAALDQDNAATAGSLDPFVSGPARNAQADEAERQPWRAHEIGKATAALDRFARVGLELARLANKKADRLRVAEALARLRDLGVEIGWEHPATLEDATARTLADTACGEDSQDERPDQCDLTGLDREALRREVQGQLLALAERFGQECERHATALKAAIARDQKIAELIAGILVDALLIAMTGGVGSVATGAAAAAEAAAVATAEVATVAVEVTGAAIREFAGKVAQGLVKTALGKGPATLAPDEPAADPRRKTVGFVDGLASTFTAATAALADHLRSLDDHALRILDGAIRSITPGDIRKRLDPLVNAYRDQIEPIGDTSSDRDLWSRRDTVNRAARIRGAGGSQLALVAYTSDARPDARRGARAVAATIAGAMDKHHLGDPSLVADVPSGDFSDAGLQAWVVAPYDEIEFIRWIDDPEMAAIADKEAIDLPAERVHGLPYLGYLGVREANGAR